MSQMMEEEGMAPAEEQDYSLDFTGEETDEKGQNLPLVEEQPAQEQTQEGQPTEQLQEQPLSDVESLQRQLNDALGIINQYKQQELSQPKEQKQEPSQAQTLQAQQPGEVPKLDFLQGRDHLDILQDPEKFNNLLCQVATVSFQAAVNAAQEQVMKRIPDIVQSAAQQQASVQSLTQEFYAKNPDLTPFKQAVSMAAMQLYNENPNLTLPDLLTQAGERTRGILRLSKAGAQPGRRPAQPAGGSVRSAGGNRQQAGTPQMTEQERQILDLITF